MARRQTTTSLIKALKGSTSPTVVIFHRRSALLWAEHGYCAHEESILSTGSTQGGLTELSERSSKVALLHRAQSYEWFAVKFWWVRLCRRSVMFFISSTFVFSMDFSSSELTSALSSFGALKPRPALAVAMRVRTRLAGAGKKRGFGCIKHFQSLWTAFAESSTSSPSPVLFIF